MFITKKRHKEILRIEREYAVRDWNSANEDARKKGRLAAEMLAERDAARKALREIVAMKTENCAHIGKRMAAVAAAYLSKIPA